jgi:hypothetical protein
MSVHEINSKLEALGTELRGILAATDPSPAADARMAAIELEAASLKQRRSAAMLADELERNAAATPLGGTGDNRFSDLTAGVSMLDVVRAQMGDTSHASGRAREASQEMALRSGRSPQGLFWKMDSAPAEQRVFTTTNPAGGPGSNLIQTTVSPNVIDRLR